MSGPRPKRHSVGVALASMLAFITAGCGTSHGAADGPPTSPAASPTARTDPNIANCVKVNGIMYKVRQTFVDWVKTDHENLTDARVAKRLRAEATRLYNSELDATGPAKDAIHAEASALVNLSIAMEAGDTVTVGNASTAANQALAALRGTCNF